MWNISLWRSYNITYNLLQQLLLFLLFHYTLFHFSACIVTVHTSLLTLWPTCRITRGMSCFHDYWPENEAQDIMFPWLPSPDWNSKCREVRRNKSTQWRHPITTQVVSGAGQCIIFASGVHHGRAPRCVKTAWAWCSSVPPPQSLHQVSVFLHFQSCQFRIKSS